MTRSVLLVDDNPGDRDLVELAIEESGWEVSVSTAADGQEAMQILVSRAAEHRLPDLVLLDLNMPRVTGWDLLALMQDERFTSVRRFALATSRSADDHARAMRLGAERCYVKPYAFADLVTIIDEIRRMFESGANRSVVAPV